MYAIQFMCEHHRECHQGRLLVNFEGRTWQVLNAGVRDRISDIGRRHMKWFRYVFATVVTYYFTYLWWASAGLDICNAAEVAAGAPFAFLCAATCSYGHTGQQLTSFFVQVALMATGRRSPSTWMVIRRAIAGRSESPASGPCCTQYW